MDVSFSHGNGTSLFISLSSYPQHSCLLTLWRYFLRFNLCDIFLKWYIFIFNNNLILNLLFYLQMRLLNPPSHKLNGKVIFKKKKNLHFLKLHMYRQKELVKLQFQMVRSIEKKLCFSPCNSIIIFFHFLSFLSLISNKCNISRLRLMLAIKKKEEIRFNNRSFK